MKDGVAEVLDETVPCHGTSEGPMIREGLLDAEANEALRNVFIVRTAFDVGPGSIAYGRGRRSRGSVLSTTPSRARPWARISKSLFGSWSSFQKAKGPGGRLHCGRLE